MPEAQEAVETRGGFKPLVLAESTKSLTSVESWCDTRGASPGENHHELLNAETGPLPTLRSIFGGDWRHRSGELSEGPSESSAGSSHTLLSDEDFQSKIPHLERFYQQLAARGRLPERNGPGEANWVLSLARSYRRMSNDKRRRGRLRALLRQVSRDGDAELCRSSDGQAGDSLTSSSLAGGSRSLTGRGFAGRLGSASDLPGFSSNTDDSGYEAGYETDADESELSEWESGSKPQRHKRKLDALVQLTMRLSVSEGAEEDAALSADLYTKAPPLKTPRAIASMQPPGFSRTVAPPPPFNTTQSVESNMPPTSTQESTVLPAAGGMGGQCMAVMPYGQLSQVCGGASHMPGGNPSGNSTSVHMDIG
mmetsp:Transcript_64485/g.119977  ORF Transcript_64485/g.119977 Transcript_64485/m.119977 type:complete len:366 (+) Transcript_64485:69-1166(+)